MKYPKGSEWRKWDLHIHTKADNGYHNSSYPEISKKEQTDEYPKVFIEHIYKIENLGAIAITDHNKADWIDKIIEENNNYYYRNGSNDLRKITIFPGVEIESSDSIHLLVIFNPETQLAEVKANYRKPTWKETIEHFITAIKNRENVEALKTTEEILVEAEKWDGLCIFAHANSNKGFLKRHGCRMTNIYKHRLTQIFEIKNLETLNEGEKNIVNGLDPNYGNKSVAIITASDAKRLEEIGKNNLWIKADPTFEGLKQIIYEPQDRIYIGEEPPRKLDRGEILKSITISNSKGWFDDHNPILLNEGLVSIIGGKGTGKTAILDLIAYATRTYKCFEKDESKSKSFLKRAHGELRGAKIKIEWDNGKIDEITIEDKLKETTEPKVRYLPQDFVDQLCSEIGKNEIEEQIENVIFQKIPAADKASFIDFKGYKKNRLTVINDKKNRLTQQLQEINKKIFEHNERIKSKGSKEKEKQEIEDKIKMWNQQMEKVSRELKDSKEQKAIEELNSSCERKSELETRISELKNEIRSIEEIKNKINVFKEDSEKFIKEIKPLLQTAKINQEHIEKFKVVLYPENLEEILNSRKSELEKEIKDQSNYLSEIENKIKELDKTIRLEKSKQDEIKEINKSLSDLKKNKDAIDRDIKKIEKAKEELPSLLTERENLFIRYFDLIFEEKETLKQIYSPLESFLEASGEENERLFQFTVKFNFDTELMARKGDTLIDHSKEGKFWRKEWQVLQQEIEKSKFSLDLEKSTISELDKENIKKFLANVKDLFSKDEKGKQVEIATQLRSGYNEQNFFDWLYSTEYYNISYSIKFNGIELNNLSPGLKGVALLILFLELDKDDTRPILIDQPEENLDNRSVYFTLVRYFREAKKRRQVIIVTHNPNLVVNTDSEQVIVADFDKESKRQPSKIYYVSGSLENTFKDDSAKCDLEKQGIREHVCTILEGGKEAFEKREKKYGFKTS